jgi:DNA-binding CsgD family transcriptional regulator
MARRLADPQALAFALRNAYIEWGPGRLEERREAVWEVVQLARELDDKELEVSSTCDHLQTSLLLGEPAAFDAGIESHVRLGEELQQRMQIAHGLILQSMRALLRGPISVAVHFNDELRRFVHRNSVPWAVPALDVHTLVLRWEQGRLTEFEASPFDELEPRSNLAGTCQLAFLHAELGRLDAARAVIRRLEPSRLRVTTQYLDRAFELSLLSQACSVVGALPQAEALYEAGLPFAGYMAKHTGAGACLGSVSRYLGLLATSLRRFEAAEHHFGEADEMNARFDAQPLLAHTKVDRARMHLARHGQGDRRQARALLEDAREMFERLGLGYHAGRAAELLAQPALDSARNRSRYPDGLTPREADILRLVAAGFSSREVGESLVLSVRTVERHIANAYLKTGTHNRAQLTAYVLSHGLTPLAT